ncbi:MAG: hypothetical protein L0Y58_03840 [Verrucomicrobia subdivision 3 bacterium]|nr:hypothetical protein [Limisphaerales bacterium]
MTPSAGTSARPKSKRRRVLWLITVAAYLGVYIVLSLRGQYLGHNQGGQDNRDSWSPAYCAELYTSPAGRQKLRLTALGWLFLPPMLVDQWFIHRTHFE